MFCVYFSEYAERGSLYAFLQQFKNKLHFEHILQWAKDIAMGKQNNLLHCIMGQIHCH